MIFVLMLALATAGQDPAASTQPAPAATTKAGGAGPAAQDPAPRDETPEGLRPRADGAQKAPEPLKWRFRGGLDTIYDSNVIRLDDRDIDRLEDGDRPDKFRIEEADDFILAPWAEAAARFDLFGENAWGGLRIQPHFYATNDVLNYEEFTLFLRRGALSLEYEYEHDRYKREYRSLDTGLFESAFYDEHTLEGELDVPAGEIVRLEFGLALEFRDYESPFSHRDHVAFIPAADAKVALTEWLEAGLGYAIEIRNAFARSGQPDTSYVAHILEPHLQWQPAAEWTVRTAYAFEFREYTTGNSATVDPGHANREDVRRYWTLGLEWKASKSVAVDAEYRRSDADSDLPGDPSATAEETTWSRNEVVLGLTVQF